MIDLDAIEQRAKAATPGPWEESWRPVPSYEGTYDVSDAGRVRSYLRPGHWRDSVLVVPRVMSETRRNGYKTVALTRDGVHRTHRVHRLVLAAFVGPCPRGHEGAHLNGDRTDNRLVNLVWSTHRDNESHKRGHGTDPVGERNGLSRLVGWQVAEIRYLHDKCIPQASIASLFGVSRSAVSEIVNGERWLDVEAREDIPALIAEVRALRAAARELRAASNVIVASAFGATDNQLRAFVAARNALDALLGGSDG